MVIFKDSKWVYKTKESNYLTENGSCSPDIEKAFIYNSNSICNTSTYVPLDKEIEFSLGDLDTFYTTLKNCYFVLKHRTKNEYLSHNGSYYLCNPQFFNIDEVKGVLLNSSKILYLNPKYVSCTNEINFIPFSEVKFLAYRDGKVVASNICLRSDVDYWVNQPDVQIYPMQNCSLSNTDLKDPLYKKIFDIARFAVCRDGNTKTFYNLDGFQTNNLNDIYFYDYKDALEKTKDLKNSITACLYLPKSFTLQFDIKEINMTTNNPQAPNTSNPVTTTSFLDVMKKEMTSAGYRIAGDQMINGLQSAALAGLSAKGMNNDKMQIAKELIESELGMATFRVALGLMLTHAPVEFLKNDPRLARLAEEFRVSGFQTMGNVAFETIFEYALPAIKAGMQHLPPLTEAEKEKFRISAPAELVVPIQEIPEVESTAPVKSAVA